MWLFPLLLGSWLVGASVDIPPATFGSCSLDSLDFVLQAVAVLLLTIAGLVGRRAATTSAAAVATLQVLAEQSNSDLHTLVASDRSRQSTRATTSTLRGPKEKKRPPR